MTQYAILIYGEEAPWADAAPGTSLFDDTMKGHQVFAESNGAAMRGGEALQPTQTATSIRPDATGGFAVTDGPFAETKEALGGFYIVDVEDLDAAIEVAKQVPMPFGGVEVRPVMVIE